MAGNAVDDFMRPVVIWLMADLVTPAYFATRTWVMRGRANRSLIALRNSSVIGHAGSDMP